jgi:hypothetical protein
MSSFFLRVWAFSDEEKFDKPPQAAGDGVKPPHQHFALKSFFFFSFRRSLIFEFFFFTFLLFLYFFVSNEKFFRTRNSSRFALNAHGDLHSLVAEYLVGVYQDEGCKVATQMS